MMQTEDRQIIGILVSDEELNNNSVFINRSSAIQYTLKSLSIPRGEPEYFTGYLSSFEDEIEFEDDTYLDDPDRSENFREWISKQLLIFSYKTGGDFAKVRKANLVAKPNAFDTNMRFYAVPVFAAEGDRIIMDWCSRQRFNLWRDYASLGEFQNYIYEKRSVGSLYGYDLDSFKPSFVVWKDAEGKLYAIGGITDITYDSLGGIILEGSDIFKVNISDYIKFVVYDMNANPTIIFVPEAIYKDIEDVILKDSVARKKAGKSVEEKVEIPVPTDIREVNEFSNEKLIEIDITEKTDEMIIQSMDYHSQRDGLYYSMRDFVNVHTAIKCSSLVILSGLSGTGKSQLVEVYAKALGIEERLLVIPVRPSWNDDSDLLGYVDLVHMVYRPSDTGFVDLLVSAQNNSDKMYLVCFDEMNLARVEHYFSQFLSILERQKRELQLYDEQYIGRLYNSKDYPYKIKIGDNIRFVGTVNVDESTYHFSDKVLDRANVIQLNVLNYATEWKEKPYATKRPVIWSSDDYARLLVKGLASHADRLHELLWDIHQLMQCASTKYGIGPRIVKAIETYLNNLPQEVIDNFDRRSALDYQVVQRVLTKVRGPESQLGAILDKNSTNNFERIFDQYQDLSDFDKCREMITQKQKELKAYGYCI